MTPHAFVSYYSSVPNFHSRTSVFRNQNQSNTGRFPSSINVVLYHRRVISARTGTDGSEGRKNTNSSGITDNRGNGETENMIKEVENLIGNGTESEQHTIDILNRVSELPVSVSITAVYDALRRQGQLKGYGCVRREPRELIVRQGSVERSGMSTTFQEKVRIASELPERTNLPLSALTPSGSPNTALNAFERIPNNLIQLSFLSLLWLISYVLVRYPSMFSYMDIQKARSVLFGIGTATLADQIILNGLVFDSLYHRLNPAYDHRIVVCLLYTSPSPRDQRGSRMPSSA